MNINVLKEYLYDFNYDSTINAPKIFSKVSPPEDETCPVMVTISEEGKKACKNSIQDSENNDYESMVAERAELLEQKNAPTIHYGFMLGDKLAEIIGHDKEYRSIKEKGSELLEAYANAYNEIKQGYDDGTRSFYLEDKTTESGYRKMTMEEEISELDVAFQKCASRFEAQTRQMVDLIEDYEKYYAKLLTIGGRISETATKAKEEFSKLKEEDIPENIADKMLKAKQKFVELYLSNDDRSMSIKSRLKDFEIFL